MTKKRGKQSVAFASPPVLASSATIVGPMEGEGLLRGSYDRVLEDNLNQESSWEKCEAYMLEWSIREAVRKGGLELDAVDYVLAGDLLNQLMATHFALRSIARPFLGLYGACSTMAESLLVGAMIIDGGFGDTAVAAVSSHHDAAERQYRYPTELGVQRPLGAQWTVTGSGAVVLRSGGSGPRVTTATVGRIIDAGIKDPNAMGPAMAPAAADTVLRHFADTGREVAYYDLILTGDLGSVGKQLLIELCTEQGLAIANYYEDCGCMIYRDDQDTHAGASGCASSAIVFGSPIMQKLKKGDLKKILLVGTGSLHSPTSYLQKESMPCIAHAVAIET